MCRLAGCGVGAQTEISHDQGDSAGSMGTATPAEGLALLSPHDSSFPHLSPTCD